MTYAAVVQQLKQAIIETPFPEADPDDAGHYQRTAQYEPYGYLYDPRWAILMDACGKPVLWHYSDARCTWYQEPSPPLALLTSLTGWRIELWTLQVGPWEITNWIKQQRGIT